MKKIPSIAQTALVLCCISMLLAACVKDPPQPPEQKWLLGKVVRKTNSNGKWNVDSMRFKYNNLNKPIAIGESPIVYNDKQQIVKYYSNIVEYDSTGERKTVFREEEPWDYSGCCYIELRYLPSWFFNIDYDTKGNIRQWQATILEPDVEYHDTTTILEYDDHPNPYISTLVFDYGQFPSPFFSTPTKNNPVLIREVRTFEGVFFYRASYVYNEHGLPVERKLVNRTNSNQLIEVLTFEYIPAN